MTVIGRTADFTLRKISKDMKQMDRRVQHARQLFNERIARAESEYHAALRRAIMGEVEPATAVSVEDAPETVAAAS